ncbi:MAG: hypothetical protein HYS12_12360 [Planctomycetes bacterium]|nr:hypothetical protein [Planctomycetota bacterium]
MTVPTAYNVPPGSRAATQFPAAGAAAGAVPSGTPNLALNLASPPAAALASAGSPIQRTTYEEKLPPPLRVVEPPSAASAHDSLLPDLTRPLACTDAGSEAGNHRHVMRPPAETGDGSDGSPVPAAKSPTGLPDSILMAAPESKEPKEGKGSADASPRTDKQDEKQTSLPPGSPAVRMVNTKRIVLNYHVTDVGPSGLSGVDLWYTRDGQVWQKDEGTGRSGPPYVFEVPEEGMYGFTLIAKSGLGLGKKPPQRGDLPQVWVEVDQTKPAVTLLDVQHGVGAKAREITITWSATDRNLARRPITLAYAESAEGSWTPLAANIENSGRYVWTMPASAPASFFVRVEAVDLVGNVGSAQSTKPIVIDLSQPEVQLDGVDSSEK